MALERIEEATGKLSKLTDERDLKRALDTQRAAHDELESQKTAPTSEQDLKDRGLTVANRARCPSGRVSEDALRLVPR